jgi:membrane-associated protease RseP (regulator of RpoE activity)
MSEPLAPITADPTHVSTVWVVRRSRPRYWLHILLLLLTVFSTLVVGSRMQYNFQHGLPAFTSEDDFFPIEWAIQNWHNLLLGVPFSATLMLILLCHEMGHYLYCLYYDVDASLPYFIPAPTLIGTLGAFIRIKSPMRSRRALFDIGIAGPIAGFVVAVAVLAAALLLSRPATDAALHPEFAFHPPLVFHLMHRLLLRGPAGYVPLDHMLLHPMALAAWVGMFATALNLVPGGQLDGGHIVYALSPALHRWVSRITFLVLLVGILWWWGWLTWAILLFISGMRHPQIAPPSYHPLLGYGTPSNGNTDPWPRLGAKRIALAVFSLAMLVVCIVPEPFPEAGALSSLRRHSAWINQHFPSRSSRP